MISQVCLPLDNSEFLSLLKGLDKGTMRGLEIKWGWHIWCEFFFWFCAAVMHFSEIDESHKHLFFFPFSFFHISFTCLLLLFMGAPPFMGRCHRIPKPFTSKYCLLSGALDLMCSGSVYFPLSFIVIQSCPGSRFWYLVDPQSWENRPELWNS